MNSWLTLVLPKDEYKQQRLYQFLAEAAVLAVLYLVVMIGVSLMWTLDASITLLGGLAIVLFYTLARYVLSGMEYTEVFTKSDYKQQLKKITIQTMGFGVLYFVVYSLISGLPSNGAGWLEIGGFFSILLLMYFGIHFISLRRSYSKNRRALD